MALVFVYGTLKCGHYNHSVLGDSQFMGEYKTAERWGLVNLGAFPGLVAGPLSVKGEVYDVDEATLKRIDRLEGVGYGLYMRHKIPIYNLSGELQDESVWTYIYGSVGDIIKNYDTLMSEWVAHV